MSGEAIHFRISLVGKTKVAGFDNSDSTAGLNQSRPQSLRSPCPAERENEESCKKRLNSAFHWSLTERAQFHRKLRNNNFVPRFPNFEPRAMDVKALRTIASSGNMAYKTPGKSWLRHINQQHIRRCSSFSGSSAIVVICFGAYLRERTFRI